MKRARCTERLVLTVWRHNEATERTVTMGTWGTGNFDNDIAGDWGYGLDEAKYLTLVYNAVDAVLRGKYIASDVACEALAAIETVARLRGRWGERNAYTETIDNWVESHQDMQLPDDLLLRTTEAIDLILGEDSELNELWSDTDDYDEWKEAVSELRARIVA